MTHRGIIDRNLTTLMDLTNLTQRLLVRCVEDDVISREEETLAEKHALESSKNKYFYRELLWKKGESRFVAFYNICCERDNLQSEDVLAILKDGLPSKAAEQKTANEPLVKTKSESVQNEPNPADNKSEGNLASKYLKTFWDLFTEGFQSAHKEGSDKECQTGNSSKSKSDADIIPGSQDKPLMHENNRACQIKGMEIISLPYPTTSTIFPPPMATDPVGAAVPYGFVNVSPLHSPPGIAGVQTTNYGNYTQPNYQSTAQDYSSALMHMHSKLVPQQLQQQEQQQLLQQQQQQLFQQQQLQQRLPQQISNHSSPARINNTRTNLQAGACNASKYTLEEAQIWKLSRKFPTMAGMSWVFGSGGSVPGGSLIAGTEDGAYQYVARAVHNGGLIPGKLCPQLGYASIPWGTKEHLKESYQVLVVPSGCVDWVPTRHDMIPDNAIPGGFSEDGEELYIGRYLRSSNGNIIVGKIQPNHGCIYFSFQGTEYAKREFEILVGSGLGSDCYDFGSDSD